MKMKQIRAKTNSHYIYLLWVVLFLFISASQADQSDTVVRCYYMYPAYYKLYKKPVLTWLFNTDNSGKQTVYAKTDRKDMKITHSSIRGNELIGLEVYGTIFRPHRMRSSCEIKDVAWTLVKSNLDDMKGPNKICKQFEDDIKNLPGIQYWTMDRGGLHRPINLFCIAKVLPNNSPQREDSYSEPDGEIEPSFRKEDSCNLTEKEDALEPGEQCALPSNSISPAGSGSSSSSSGAGSATITNGAVEVHH